MTRCAFESKKQYRYFSHKELMEIFAFMSPYTSQVFDDLCQVHGDWKSVALRYKFEDHFNFLMSTSILGVTDHGSLFSQQPQEPADEEKEKQPINRRAEDEEEERRLIEGVQRLGTNPINLPVVSVESFQTSLQGEQDEWQKLEIDLTK